MTRAIVTITATRGECFGFFRRLLFAVLRLTVNAASFLLPFHLNMRMEYPAQHYIA